MTNTRPKLEIRALQEGDVDAASAIIHRSIVELCIADHHNDADEIAGWTANKSPSDILAWMQNPHVQLYMAWFGDTPAGVGCVNRAGEILLNYVSPKFRVHGVSDALLSTMEAQLIDWGCDTARLDSTKTAHEFYLNRGWSDDATTSAVSQPICLPMKKRLQK